MTIKCPWQNSLTVSSAVFYRNTAVTCPMWFSSPQCVILRRSISIRNTSNYFSSISFSKNRLKSFKKYCLRNKIPSQPSVSLEWSAWLTNVLKQILSQGNLTANNHWFISRSSKHEMAYVRIDRLIHHRACACVRQTVRSRIESIDQSRDHDIIVC